MINNSEKSIMLAKKPLSDKKTQMPSPFFDRFLKKVLGFGQTHTYGSEEAVTTR